MVPKPQKEFQNFVDDIPDSKINWQNYSRGEGKVNVFQNDMEKEPFRMDLQKFIKGDDEYESDPYLDLAVQSNAKGGKKTSTVFTQTLRKGHLGPVFATLKIHPDARPDAATFKQLLLKAGKDCHINVRGEPVSYCIQIEPDGSWRNHQTGETGMGTIFVPPNQKKPAPAPAAPAQDEQDQDDKNNKGKKKDKKGGK